MPAQDIPLDERIIYALDFADKKAAIDEIDRTCDAIKFYKIGLELFLASHWAVVDYVLEKGAKVMLDLKFLDIPATVHGAVRQAEQHGGISLLTVHGHQQTILAAMQARQSREMNILGVTLLTSFGKDDMIEFGEPAPDPRQIVIARAKRILAAGADGLVASPEEADLLKRSFNYMQDFILVTPGIRWQSPDSDDQKRVSSPLSAIACGADYLVVGRPIRLSRDHDKVIKIIQQEIETGLTQRNNEH